MYTEPKQSLYVTSEYSSCCIDNVLDDNISRSNNNKADAVKYHRYAKQSQRLINCSLFLPRDAIHSADYAVARCLSVSRSVKRR